MFENSKYPVINNSENEKKKKKSYILAQYMP